MPQHITLVLTPKQAADATFYTSQAARRMGVSEADIALARVVKRSIDARQRQVKVVLVSRFPKSPGGQLADVVLQCGADEGPLQAGSVNARMAQLFVLDVLFQEFCMRAPEETEQSREQIAEAVARKHL